MNSEPIRVLHVDDDPDFGELTATFLEKEDDRFVVETVTSAEEGLDSIRDGPPDCIVSDYDMPKKTGIEFLQRVREDWPELPFVLFTGEGSETIASEAIKHGVTDYLQKGGSERYEILANRIENIVSEYRANRELEATRERCGKILEHSSDFIMVGDEAGKLSYVSPAVERILGYDHEELIGTNAFDFVHPDDVDRAIASLGDIIKENGREDRLNFRVKHQDGSWRWVEARRRNLLKDPVIEGVLVSVRDITERKQKEKDLERRKKQLQGILDSVDAAIWMRDLESRYRLINQRFRDMFDIPEDVDATGGRLEGFLSEETTTQFRGNDQKAWEKGETVEIEETLMTEEGEKTFLTRISPLYNDDGTPYATCGVATDITVRKEYEVALDEAREELRQVIDLVPDPIFANNREGEYLLANEATAETFGKNPEEVEGSKIQEVVSDEGEPDRLLADDLEVIESGESTTVTEKITTADGETRQFKTTRIPYSHSSGEEAVLGYARDITELKDRESRLKRQNERLNEFASVISHDLRSPLSVAMGRAELVAEECDSDYITDVTESLSRMDVLIEDLLKLARQGRDIGERDRIVVEELAADCWENVEPSGATLVTNGKTAVSANRSRLKQAFENLFRNAVDHGDESVTVTVGPLDNEDGFYIEDDGAGIPEEGREDVFESGFSTNPEGTGFGLAIVNRICEAHGWEITADESDAGGARFEVKDVETTERGS